MNDLRGFSFQKEQPVYDPFRGVPIFINEMFGDGDVSPAFRGPGFVCNSKTFEKMKARLDQNNLWHDVWTYYCRRQDTGKRALRVWLKRQLDFPHFLKGS